MTTAKDDLIAAARAAATASQWPDVLRLTDAVIVDDHNHPIALRLRARALANLERADDAFEAWEAVARVSPDLVEAPLNLARIEKRRGNWLAVLPPCDRVLKMHPGHTEALKLAALAIERDPMSTPSTLIWQNLVQNDISGFLSIVLELDSQGRLTEAANAIASAAEVRPDDNAIRQEQERLTQDLADRARSLENTGDFAGAAVLLRAAGRVDRHGGETFRARLARIVKPLVAAGRDAYQAKEFNRAIELFAEVLVYDPDNSGALIGLARCREQTEDWAQATQLWSRVIELDPSNQQAWLRLGVGSDRVGDPRRALDAFDRVNDPQLADSVARGRERLAHTAYKAARGRYVAGEFEQAADALEVVIALQDSTEAVASLRSRIARALNRSQRQAFGDRDNVAAVRIGSRLLATEPDDAEPWILQARALHALKRSEDALRTWLEADKRAPNRADVQLGIARSAHDLGAFNESRAAVTKALSIAPGDPKCLELLAKLDQKQTVARA